MDVTANPLRNATPTQTQKDNVDMFLRRITFKKNLDQGYKVSLNDRFSFLSNAHVLVAHEQNNKATKEKKVVQIFCAGTTQAQKSSICSPFGKIPVPKKAVRQPVTRNEFIEKLFATMTMRL